MFVSSLSEVDVFLSQVNVLLTEVNKKLGDCSVGSRSVILPRIYNIIEELEWTMSLSEESSDYVIKEIEGDCTYSGAFSPPASLSSSSFDVESLSWDHSDFYKLYYENDADDEDEDYGEKKYEDDDHGPIQFSAFSPDESSKDEEFADSGEKQCEDATDAEVPAEDATPVGEDEGEVFVSKMSASIQKLAPDSTYTITRPRQYRVDLSQVNSRFLGNIPRPKEYPTLGCMTEAESKEKILTGYGWIQKPRRSEWQWGFMTDCGIVPVPEEPVYGHVWSASARDWILHATPDDGSGPPPPPRQRGGRFRG